MNLADRAEQAHIEYVALRKEREQVRQQSARRRLLRKIRQTFKIPDDQFVDAELSTDEDRPIAIMDDELMFSLDGDGHFQTNLVLMGFCPECNESVPSTLIQSLEDLGQILAADKFPVSWHHKCAGVEKPDTPGEYEIELRKMQALEQIAKQITDLHVPLQALFQVLTDGSMIIRW